MLGATQVSTSVQRLSSSPKTTLIVLFPVRVHPSTKSVNHCKNLKAPPVVTKIEASVVRMASFGNIHAAGPEINDWIDTDAKNEEWAS